jgi:hypothetical protein
MEEYEMEPSKLPQNPPPPHPHVPHHPTPQELATPPKTNVHHYGSPLPGGFIPAEAWMSLVIGIIVLFMFPSFGEYVVMHNHLDDFYAKPNNTFLDKNGQSIPFEQSAFFYATALRRPAIDHAGSHHSLRAAQYFRDYQGVR